MRCSLEAESRTGRAPTPYHAFMGDDGSIETPMERATGFVRPSPVWETGAEKQTQGSATETGSVPAVRGVRDAHTISLQPEEEAALRIVFDALAREHVGVAHALARMIHASSPDWCPVNDRGDPLELISVRRELYAQREKVELLLRQAASRKNARHWDGWLLKELTRFLSLPSPDWVTPSSESTREKHYSEAGAQRALSLVEAHINERLRRKIRKARISASR